MTKQSNIEGLIKIFEIQKKNLLDKHCKNITIYGTDFAQLINLADAGKTKYHHRIHRRELNPKDLQSTLDTLPNINFDNIDKSSLFKKLSQVIKVRRQLIGHMFFNNDVSQWHFFYFDQRDTTMHNNRWVYGSHIHLINYLSPNHDPVYVLKEFYCEKPHFTNKHHIRFIDN